MSAAKPRTVYTTLPSRNGLRVSGVEGIAPAGYPAVLVHVVGPNGGMVGWYRLTRFRDGRLTAATLRDVLEGNS